MYAYNFSTTETQSNPDWLGLLEIQPLHVPEFSRVPEGIDQSSSHRLQAGGLTTSLSSLFSSLISLTGKIIFPSVLPEACDCCFLPWLCTCEKSLQPPVRWWKSPSASLLILPLLSQAGEAQLPQPLLVPRRPQPSARLGGPFSAALPLVQQQQLSCAEPPTTRQYSKVNLSLLFSN